MKAVRFHQYGDPDVLVYEEVNQPTPGAGDVLVRVAATTFNGVDANIRAGLMQEPMPLDLPHIPGLDVAGTVEEVGEGVENPQVGDRVVGFLPFTADGAAAEYVVAAADGLAPAPSSVPLADAAALPLVGLTAWQALHEHANLTSGQRILINGASGAVGGYAVQLAKSAGAHVIATAGPQALEAVQAAGAAELIDWTATDVAAAVEEPVDVLLNLAPINPDDFGALASRVRDGGVVVNTTVWMPAPSDPSRGVEGIDLYVRSDAAQLAHLVDLVDRGELRIEVGQRAGLKDLARVHSEAAAGKLTGKVVITPDDV
ncbi:NADP-dependent oxidoreductase [Luteipulveratus sp. YIM 133132]|uniref:NADP-dependent oxidoreductase n=1 Tax=Luteipulveratus flavus TaxID=3031728 RepID=UPI0023B0A670|nr:NADP-dependent oxidoreductase [Luteipulveratus sp. YIM 133132]MDE9367759.1 NADP-dependent oxidoreductase [Luteipulveratus sp. YIM 133132]